MKTASESSLATYGTKDVREVRQEHGNCKNEWICQTFSYCPCQNALFSPEIQLNSDQGASNLT